MSTPGAFHDASQVGVPVEVADYVIVGSGAGGGAAARVLARSGRSVAVLEEGPLVSSETVSPIIRHSMGKLFRNQGRFAALGRTAIPILQGRCVGGTTFVNSAIIWRLPEKVLARWHEEHHLQDGLPAADLDDAFRILEEEMHVRAVADDIAGHSNLLMRDGAARLRIAGRAIQRNELGCRGSGRCVHGCPNDAKQSTAINYLRRAVADGADVVAHVAVERVVLEGDRAVAVTGTISGTGPASGRAFTVRARRAVIVAASAVQSPNLLRRSGLRRYSGAIGDYFMAHPGTSVAAIYPERVNAWWGASQGYEAYGMRDRLGVKFEVINVPPEVAASRLPGAGRRLAGYIEKIDRLALWAAALRADAIGRVRPSWLMGDSVRYSLLASDMERLRAGLKVVAEMHFAAGAVEVLPSIHGMPETLTSPDDLKYFDDAPLDARNYGMIATHLFGGCRAGKDPRTSVVDPTLAVHGTRGLYVMDASVFPSNTGVNPQHSIMAVATVAARRLAAA